jgi:LPXTG-motif cell wall-anchored protein
VTPKGPTPPTPITPEIPTSTLPETGIESGLAGILGMTGISASVYAYQKSKKSMYLIPLCYCTTIKPL